MYNENLDNLTVVKRSGQRVEFNASKVALAIKKAFDSVNDKTEEGVFKTFEKVLAYINENYKDRKTINVEEIQDIIEQILKEQKYDEVYNSFKEYRNKRTLSRKIFPEKQQHKFLKAIEKFEENDFKNSSVKGPNDLLHKFGLIIYDEYTKTYVLDTKSVRSAEEGNIYIHNLNYFSLGILSDTHLKLENRVINGYDIDEIIDEVNSSQKEINGEIGINRLDYILEIWLLKKYKEKLKFYLRKYFKLLGFYELLNFKKIEEVIDKENYDIDLDKFNLILPNEKTKEIFKEAEKDANFETLNLCEKTLLKTFKSLEKNIIRNNNYIISFGSNQSSLGKVINTKIVELLNKKKYSNIKFVFKINRNANYIQEILQVLSNQKEIYIENIAKGEPEYFSNGLKIYKNVNNTNDVSSGRFIVSNTSINLSRLGLKYQNKSLNDFFKELESISELVKNQLCLSFETIGNKTKENYQTIFTGNIFDDEKLETGQKIRKVIKNGVLSIGLVGLKECVINLEKDKTEQIKLIHKILDFLNEKCKGFSSDTKLNFGIHETVDEKSRTHLLKIDKAIYGTVKNVTDKSYYELIDEKLVNLDELKKIQDKFSYGKSIMFKIDDNNVESIVKTILDQEIEFTKLEVNNDTN